ncbi:MAG: hypothetical protein HQM00_15525 [Magnetococcales bacterium]|nr:hypothetical protein [Magnetococcales bacterium]
MFASYYYNAGASVADILDDLVLLLTGTTNKAYLSASCNKDATSISTLISVAGWELQDASAGTNGKALRSPYVDGSGYKYVYIDANVSGKIMVRLYEIWNAASHSGTNLANGSDTSGVSMDTGTGGRLQLYASARYLIIGADTGATPYPICVMEMTRMGMDALYPASIWGNLTTSLPSTSPRVSTPAGDRTGSNAYVTLCSLGISTFSAALCAAGPLAALPIYARFRGASNTSSETNTLGRQMPLGSVTAASGLYGVVKGVASGGDNIVINSTAYTILPGQTWQFLAVPNG